MMPPDDSLSSPSRRRFAKTLGLSATVIGAAALGYYVMQDHSIKEDKASPHGDVVELPANWWNQPYTDLAGQVITLSDFKGHPFLLNLWASWCAPCVRELPRINAFAQQAASKGIKVLGFAAESPKQLRSFMATYATHLSYPIVPVGIDEGLTWVGRLSNDEVHGIPFSIFFDVKGQILQRISGVLTEADFDVLTQ